MELLFLLFLIINVVSGILLLPYPINLFFLTISSIKWKDPIIKEYYDESSLPTVTIQLPVFNEAKIIKRTLSRVTEIIYPPNKLLIQILDDSIDNTSSIIDSEVISLSNRGIPIEVIRRKNREGYKAGALTNGLNFTESEFIAVFDADFQVDPHFLKNTIHYFKNNSQIGAIQTRWEHSNLGYSIFTRSMSIGLDGHFLVEKIGRKARNAFIGFSGTGGIWRRSIIKNSGGWSSETLAEDLDLSYRAQINGYKILYLRNISNTQEIPPTLRCWVIQQSRWSKGFSQNLMKNFLLFWRNAKDSSRLQGTIHLTQYFVPLLICMNTISGSILLYFPKFESNFFFFLGILFVIAGFLGFLSYIAAVIRANRPLKHIFFIPLFLFWGAGLIIRMAVGTVGGLVKSGGEFVRTPKFNIYDGSKQVRKNIREKIPLDWIFVAELGYLVILWFGMLKLLKLGGLYLTQAIFYIFLLLSILNFLLSELLHAFASK